MATLKSRLTTPSPGSSIRTIAYAGGFRLASSSMLKHRPAGMARDRLRRQQAHHRVMSRQPWQQSRASRHFALAMPSNVGSRCSRCQRPVRRQDHIRIDSECGRVQASALWGPRVAACFSLEPKHCFVLGRFSCFVAATMPGAHSAQCVPRWPAASSWSTRIDLTFKRVRPPPRAARAVALT